VERGRGSAAKAGDAVVKNERTTDEHRRTQMNLEKSNPESIVIQLMNVLLFGDKYEWLIIDKF
jgi:hypothetical protein